MYKRFLPDVVTDQGLASVAVIKQLVSIRKVLDGDDSFMILSNSMNVFFLQRPNKCVHCVTAFVVSKEEYHEAFVELEKWHTEQFPHIQLLFQ